jgi:hypothetical protein
MTEQPQLPGVDWKPRSLEKRYDQNQRHMAAWLESVRDRYRLVVVNASRQIGKSFWLCVMMTIYGLENPGAQIKYGAKTQKHVRKIIKPHLRAIFRDLPEELRPEWSQEDGEYVFKNDATITVAGCDKDYAEALVGQHAHLFIIDEGGAIKDLAYVVRDIALPQTLNTNGQLIIASTPARTGGHAYKSFCDEAKSHGTYIERDIFENRRISDNTIREMCELAGGPLSSTWRREYLVQHVTDESTAGVPEATRARLNAITVTDEQLRVTRSPWVDRYIAVMPMWNPNFTGVLWGHFDYRKNRMVVEDNYILRKMDSLLLTQVMAERSERLWGPEADVFRCIAPIDDALIVELADLGWQFVPTTVEISASGGFGKNIDTAMQKVRHSTTHRRGVPLFIHERCEDLKRQLENATWDATRKRFERSDLDGFYPLLTALVCWRQDMNEKHDPTPENAANRRAIIHPDFGRARSAKHASVRKIFGIR